MLDIVAIPILPKASTEGEINNFNKYQSLEYIEIHTVQKKLVKLI